MTKINAVDLTTDAGFAKLASMGESGELSLLKPDVDIQMLLEKQAYADASSFADIVNKKFSIASPTETYISAKYAEKCANDLEDDVLTRINEACDVFNLNLEIHRGVIEKTAGDPFRAISDETVDTMSNKDATGDVEKVASTTYGTELDLCLAARSMVAPEYAEDFEKLASMIDELDPAVMVNILSDLDAEAGIDLPWVQCKIGSPEYAVYEKRASDPLTINLGIKSVDFYKVAALQDQINDMGIELDFDSQDAYATKLALEGLPRQIKEAIAKLC